MNDEPWTLADSSNVAGFRRGGPNGVNLEVWFNNGARYEYVGAGDLYEAMNAAASKGRFVWNHLRNNYLYNKV